MNALHRRVVLLWSIRVLAVAVVAGALVAGAATLLQQSPLYGLAVGGVICLLGVAHSVAHYRRWRFVLESDALELQRGVLTQVDSSVPYVRIQHVDTQRTPLARAIGLSAVVVYTAGSRGADVTIPGLSPSRARGLHDRLRELAIESEPGDEPGDGV
ncbi:MAG: PH domain-containing protein [Haloferacaceae archaeon]